MGTGMRTSNCDRKHGQPWALIAVCCMFLLLLLVVLICYLKSPDPLAAVWIDRDFVNYWIASRLVLDNQHADLFSGQERYFAHLTTAFGADYPWRNWSYPPHYLLLTLPLATMSFGVAMVAFLGVSLVLFFHSVWCFGRKANAPTALLLIPFCISNIFFSQNGFLISAMMLYGLAFRRSHPLMAGVAFALLTVKPQLGLLVPILLIAERRYATIAATVAVTAVLVSITIVLWGFDVWRGYFSNNLPYQSEVMMSHEGVFLHMMPTIFGVLRSLGTEATISLHVHMAWALGVFVVFVVSLWRLTSDNDRAFSLLLASFLFSPYSLAYDMGALVAVAAIAFSVRPGDVGPRGVASLAKYSFAVLATLPILHAIFSLSSWPIGPAVIATAWACLLMKDVGSRMYPVRHAG